MSPAERADRIRRPTTEEVVDLARKLHMSLDPEAAEEMAAMIDRGLSVFDRIDDIPQPVHELKYPRREPGRRPTKQEDPLNLFITKCDVRGAGEGRLAGVRVGLKDNICVAGIPMTNGSRMMEGFIPDFDAVVVERLLDAGARIVGKTNLDDFSFCATGETSAFGCPRNPLNPAHSPGGSSGGSAAAVASGDVELALGVDQGGSARIPAAWCGVTSIKPTHGLVPSYGITHMDHTLDFVCPIAKSVEDLALALEVLAGDDPRDPQWVRGPIRQQSYTSALAEGIRGAKIGVLKEAFEWRATEPDVARAVRDTLRQLGAQGVSCEEVSLPAFRDAPAIWTVLTVHSVTAMLESDGEGYWRGGFCDVARQEAFGRARRSHADDFSPLLKLATIEGKYMMDEYFSTYFSKAQNLRMAIRQEIDGMLRDYHALAMPTTPMRAYRLAERQTLRELGSKAAAAGFNANPFNLTGHPALTVPCGHSGGLPVGLQLVAGHWEEATLLRLGAAVERLVSTA